MDVNCGEEFTVVITIDKKIEYQSNELKEFRSRFYQQANIQSKFKGRILDTTKLVP